MTKRTKPDLFARKPFVIGRMNGEGRIKLSQNPRQHDKREAAMVEAERLHGLHDQRFVVLGTVAMTKGSAAQVYSKQKTRANTKMRLCMSDVLDSLVLS